MATKALEAQFEAQLDELQDRLQECLVTPAMDDAIIARKILESLIVGYQERLSEIRARRICLVAAND